MSHTLDARTDSTLYRGGTGEERGSKVTADDKGGGGGEEEYGTAAPRDGNDRDK